VLPNPATDHGDLSHTSGGLEDIDFFVGQPGHHSESTSTYFPDNLSGNSQSMTVSSILDAHFDSSGLHQSTDPTLVNMSDGEFDAYFLAGPDFTDKDDRLNRLLDIQARLGKLIRCLSSGPSVSEIVEDTYKASETLISILDSIEEPYQPGSPSSPLRPNGTIVLLSSSCYVSLIHAYELLAVLLHEELRRNPNPPVAKDRSSGTMAYDGQPTPLQDSMPHISVGAVRLMMPRRAVAEINIHLIMQMAQHLKASMQHFAARMATAQVHRGVSSELPRGVRSSEEKVGVEGCNSITDLAETAQYELRRREENLLTQLRTTMLVVESGKMRQDKTTTCDP